MSNFFFASSTYFHLSVALQAQAAPHHRPPAHHHLRHLRAPPPHPVAVPHLLGSMQFQMIDSVSNDIK